MQRLSTQKSSPLHPRGAQHRGGRRKDSLYSRGLSLGWASKTQDKTFCSLVGCGAGGQALIPRGPPPHRRPRWKVTSWRGQESSWVFKGGEWIESRDKAIEAAMDRCTGCVSSLVSDLGSRAPFLGKHPTTPQPQLSSAVSQPEVVKCPFSPEILSQFVITNFLSHKAAVTPSATGFRGPRRLKHSASLSPPSSPGGLAAVGGGRYAPFNPQGNSFCSLLLKMWPNRQKDMKSINCVHHAS